MVQIKGALSKAAFLSMYYILQE